VGTDYVADACGSGSWPSLSFDARYTYKATVSICGTSHNCRATETGRSLSSIASSGTQRSFNDESRQFHIPVSYVCRSCVQLGILWVLMPSIASSCSNLEWTNGAVSTDTDGNRDACIRSAHGPKGQILSHLAVASDTAVASVIHSI
jgi:hypothetical protein